MEELTFDIREGCVVKIGNDKEIEIPPHSERIYMEVWANGYFDFLFYSEPQPGFDPSDRIHWMMHGFDGRHRGVLLNVEDAIAIIRGLSIGIQRAINADVPTKPQDNNREAT